MSLRDVKRGDLIVVQETADASLRTGTIMAVGCWVGHRFKADCVSSGSVRWFRRSGWDTTGTVLAVPIAEYRPPVPTTTVPKEAWHQTPEGRAWLDKNMPHAPEELRVYRRGQVFRVKGLTSPFMLVTANGARGIHACLVSLSSGNRYGGHTIPTQPQYTSENISYLLGGRYFELVADSAEEYFKEKFNAENN